MQVDDDSTLDRHPAITARIVLATTNDAERVLHAFGHVHT